MTEKGKPADKYIVRFPKGMRAKLAKLAAANNRSMNAEIIAALEKHLAHDDRVASLTSSVTDLDKRVRDTLELLKLDPDKVRQIWGTAFSRLELPPSKPPKKD